MIRVYFVFKDPFDDTEINLSFADVPTRDPHRAFERVEEAADSGELWKSMYPDDQEHPYTLIKTKMMSFALSTSPHRQSSNTVLSI
jgi:hypothetical protein